MRRAGVSESQIWAKLPNGLVRPTRAGVRRKGGLSRSTAGARGTGPVGKRITARSYAHRCPPSVMWHNFFLEYWIPERVSAALRSSRKSCEWYGDGQRRTSAHRSPETAAVERLPKGLSGAPQVSRTLIGHSVSRPFGQARPRSPLTPISSHALDSRWSDSP